MAELSETSVYSESNLKAYYRFESGALTTDTKGGHTLSATGDPAETTGKYGGGVDLDANDLYSASDHADFKPTGNFTVGAWVKNPQNASEIFESWAGAGGAWGGIRLEYQGASGKVGLFSYKNTGIVENTDWKKVVSTAGINDGDWHLVVGTWDGSTLSIYVDNNTADTASWADGPAYQATNYVTIGGENGGASYLQASLDDLFLIKGTAITSDQVLELYTDAVSGGNFFSLL
jgi:hypothetical protein